VLDGYAATQQIRRGNASSDEIRRPWCSDGLRPRDRDCQSGEAGCTSLVTKPIKFAELMQTIEKYAGGCCVVVDPHIEPKLRVLIPGYIESRRRDLETLRGRSRLPITKPFATSATKCAEPAGLTDCRASPRSAPFWRKPRGSRIRKTIRTQTDELARFLARAGGAPS